VTDVTFTAVTFTDVYVMNQIKIFLQSHFILVASIVSINFYHYCYCQVIVIIVTVDCCI